MPGTDRKVFPEQVKDRDGNETEKGGLLAPLGNPLGSVFETGLKPLGAGVGALTGSISEGASTVTKGIYDKAGLEDKGEAAEREEQRKKDRIGGKEQSSENPLGL